MAKDQPFQIGVGTPCISEKAIAYVTETLRNKRLSYGPFTQKFEAEFAKLHNARFGIMSNSGTSALHIALSALKEIHNWKAGDEVIVPAVTFIATSNIVLHNGMTVKFVDVDPDYYELDPAQLEKAVTGKTRAIIPVHLFGQPCDMDPIKKIAKDNDLRIIEDSCETMFAKYKGEYCGSLGDVGCFSTYVAHLITTGVGGLNTTSNPEYAVKIRSIMNHGRDSIYLSIDDDDGKSGDELNMIISRRFKFETLGHSFRATEMEAALGLAQVEDWQSLIMPRRSNAKYLTEGLKDVENFVQLPAIRPQTEHSFMMYPLVLKNEKKERVVNYLEAHGIETRDMLPLTNQPVYQRILKIREEDYPVAKWINENGFYVASHQDLTRAQLDYMIKTIKEAVKR